MSLLNTSLLEFDVSPQTGFLSERSPLRRLPDSYYEPWEAIVEDLPRLTKAIAIRGQVDKLPVLSTLKLRSDAEWQRAYLLLSLMAQGYVWAGEVPSEA